MKRFRWMGILAVLAAGAAGAEAQPPAKPPGGDTLVFKNSDKMPGDLVGAASGGPVRWRTAMGRQVEFQTERMAGVRLQNSTSFKPAGMIELRTGERLAGSLVGLDERQVRWQHAWLGEVTVDRAQLWRLYPNAAQALRDSDVPSELQEGTGKRERPNSCRTHDGRFILYTRNTPRDEDQFLMPICDLSNGADRYELRVDFAFLGPDVTYINVILSPSKEAKDGSVTLNLATYNGGLYLQAPKSLDFVKRRDLKTGEKFGTTRQFSLRTFVNQSAGTIDFILNGQLLERFGQTETEQLPGVGKQVRIDTFRIKRSQVLLSQVTVAPWSGELPRTGDAKPVTLLTNSDVAPGIPQALADGRWKMESDLGPLEIPVEKVQAVEFGGAMHPATAAGRVRLVDGSALLADRFQWTEGGLSVHHATFGDLQIPANAVSELIFNPATVREATVEEPKKAPPKKGKIDAAQEGARRPAA